MTFQYLHNLRIVWVQPLWYTICWGVTAFICLFLAYLPFRYIIKRNEHDPATVTLACLISAAFGMFATAPLLMVAAKIHAYILFT